MVVIIETMNVQASVAATTISRDKKVATIIVNTPTMIMVMLALPTLQQVGTGLPKGLEALGAYLPRKR